MGRPPEGTVLILPGDTEGGVGVEAGKATPRESGLWLDRGEPGGGCGQRGRVRSFAVAPRGQEDHLAQDRQPRAAVSNVEGPPGMGWPGAEVQHPIIHQATGTNPMTGERWLSRDDLTSQ